LRNRFFEKAQIRLLTTEWGDENKYITCLIQFERLHYIMDLGRYIERFENGD
jgi:hypothetical protein